ncbi:hypothetical protein CARUB_v10005893mg [Capsella rubella]|uniref:Uncharacterized protein n=1 Tax=Capsella rubella TaxID=81985 RepID=R0F6U5_9BRAS|nr:hypothetical protein CARUB_v10005893mg [Capsella rubella]
MHQRYKVRKQVTAASRAPNATAVAEIAPVSPMITILLRRYTIDVNQAMDVKRPLDVASLEGYRALWRNLRSGLVRDCLYRGVFFSIWQFLHDGMLSRTRAQCVILPKYTAKESKFLKWNKPEKRLERWTGIHPTDRNLLFRGIGIWMARSSVASTAFVGSYYVAVDLLVPK